MLRPTSIGAALFNAANARAEGTVPKHDISRWVLARMNRPGVGVVREVDTADRIAQYVKRTEPKVKDPE
jgi:hypothetical protein